MYNEVSKREISLVHILIQRYE